MQKLGDIHFPHEHWFPERLKEPSLLLHITHSIFPSTSMFSELNIWCGCSAKNQELHVSGCSVILSYFSARLRYSKLVFPLPSSCFVMSVSGAMQHRHFLQSIVLPVIKKDSLKLQTCLMSLEPKFGSSANSLTFELNADNAFAPNIRMWQNRVSREAASFEDIQNANLDKVAKRATRSTPKNENSYIRAVKFSRPQPFEVSSNINVQIQERNSHPHKAIHGNVIVDAESISSMKSQLGTLHSQNKKFVDRIRQLETSLQESEVRESEAERVAKKNEESLLRNVSKLDGEIRRTLQENLELKLGYDMALISNQSKLEIRLYEEQLKSKNLETELKEIKERQNEQLINQLRNLRDVKFIEHHVQQHKVMDATNAERIKITRSEIEKILARAKVRK